MTSTITNRNASGTYHRLTPRPRPNLISIVIPIYNEEESIPALLSRVRGVMDRLPVPSELILVNDGSRDLSADQLFRAAQEDSTIKVLSLARNFGHQIAATAGLDHAGGDAVVLMDADLQDPPELILDMLDRYLEGYDVVYAHRVKRVGESVFKRASAWVFYRVMRKFVHKDLPTDVGDFRLVSRNCLDALKSMRETHRFLRGMVSWVGFAQTSVDFVRPPRMAGETKYPFWKMMRFAWNAAVSFSPAPLRISFGFGVLLAVTGILYGVYAVIRAAIGLYAVPGWTSSVVLICIVNGATMICIGLLGEYVAKIFEEAKGRPLYIIASSANTGAKSHSCTANCEHLERTQTSEGRTAMTSRD
jgi:polyisoprenyl-phosphate glycosyltransferase